MVWILSGLGYVGHHNYEVLHEVHTQKFAFVMYYNAEMIFLSDEIHAKMPQKLSKHIWESCYIYIVVIYITHAVMYI